jgi:chromosome segregation ATPase
MSNPATELDQGSDNSPQGMSEEEILKRLEPKDLGEEGEAPPRKSDELDEEEEQAEPEQEEGEDAEERTDEERAEAEEAAWLANKRKITVQGEELEVTADEAFKGYMRQQDYTRKTQEAAQLTQQITQEKQFVKQEYEARINQLNQLAGVLYQELVGDQAKLAELAQTDPAAWVAMQQHMAQRSQLLNQVNHHASAIEAMKKNESEKSRLESLRQHEEKLLEKMPEWRDEAKRSAATREIANALIAHGYTPDELNGLSDHRAVLIAHKAMLWDRSQAVKQKQVKTEATPPKPVKPGNANTPPNAPAQKRIDELAKRAKRTGKLDDVAALLMARSK